MNPAEARGNAVFSKVRLDALNDGIFGAAMRLLILDVRLLGILLTAASLLAIALSFGNPRAALRTLALNFADP